MAEIIRVRCGGCSVKIKSPPKYQGKQVDCPQCGYRLKIPILSAADAAETRKVAPAGSAKSQPGARKPVIVDDGPLELCGNDFVQTPSKPDDDQDGFLNADLNEFHDFEDYGDVETRAAPPPVVRSKTNRRRKRHAALHEEEPEPHVPVSRRGLPFTINGGVIGGLLMMLFGAGLFIFAFKLGVIWFWPGIICIAGMIAFVRGLFGD